MLAAQTKRPLLTWSAMVKMCISRTKIVINERNSQGVHFRQESICKEIQKNTLVQKNPEFPEISEFFENYRVWFPRCKHLIDNTDDNWPLFYPLILCGIMTIILSCEILANPSVFKHWNKIRGEKAVCKVYAQTVIGIQ